MRVIIIILVWVFSYNQTAHAANWMKLKNLGAKCGASYTKNMRVVERVSPNKVKVSQKSYGHAAVGFIELAGSASKENLPLFGEILDIFVEKKKTVDGYDYWVECPPEESNLRKDH